MTTANLTIDLDAICANWRALDAMSGATTQTGAVVKADSYGLGAARVAAILAGAGARKFFVAEASEGVALRHALGEAVDIYVFCGHMAGDTDMIAGANLIPLLNSPEQFSRHVSALNGAPFGVQLDTGMNRLGMESGEWAGLRSDILALEPRLVMSHLACADEPKSPMNPRQLEVFKTMTAGVTAPRSLAATGGTLLGPDYHFDVTRPGIGLYGGLPFADARPVVRLSLPVVQIRDVATMETVGYANSYQAPSPRRVATVVGGYADGILRRLSNRATLYAGDVACPLLGRVSMDLLTVDVTELDHAPEYLDLICPAQSVDALADVAETIGYEILTSLGGRYARHYVSNEGFAA